MKNPVVIVKKDTGYGALLKRLGLKEGEVTVGVHESEGSEISEGGEYTTAEVFAISEFGGPEDKPPQRSWLRDWYEENEAKNKKAITALMKAVVEGKIASKEDALEQFGAYAVNSIQERIIARIEPENAESTIRQKGSDVPLVASGQALNAITYEVDS